MNKGSELFVRRHVYTVLCETAHGEGSEWVGEIDDRWSRPIRLLVYFKRGRGLAERERNDWRGSLDEKGEKDEEKAQNKISNKNEFSRALYASLGIKSVSVGLNSSLHPLTCIKIDQITMTSSLCRRHMVDPVTSQCHVVAGGEPGNNWRRRGSRGEREESSKEGVNACKVYVL